MPNDLANWILTTSSSPYYPSLVASGYSHRYFPALFILTPVFCAFLAGIHFVFLSSATELTKTYHPFLMELHYWAVTHPVLAVILFGCVFLSASWLIVPAFTPPSWITSYKTRDS